LKQWYIGGLDSSPKNKYKCLDDKSFWLSPQNLHLITTSSPDEVSLASGNLENKNFFSSSLNAIKSYLSLNYRAIP
jgi:hypothetical protein